MFDNSLVQAWTLGCVITLVAFATLGAFSKTGRQFLIDHKPYDMWGYVLYGVMFAVWPAMWLVFGVYCLVVRKQSAA